MDDVNIVRLSQGVEGCYIKSKKFKTSRISINMFVPTSSKSVSANALLTSLLTRCSKEYPDYTSLNARLGELYGATLYGDTVKFGDMQMLKFVIAVLDDKYTLYDEKISSDAAELLLSMIFNPPFENGLFKAEDFESEKRLLIEHINSEINDKRRYAIIKTESAIYKNEPCGVSRYGSIEEAKALTNEDVVNAWKDVLQNAFVRVNVISSSEPKAVYDKIIEYFSLYTRNAAKKNLTNPHINNGSVDYSEEHMEVSQGKLCMAFTLDIKQDEQSKTNARIMTDLFGGGPYSKLFSNVREKLSLCYYCAARLNAQKSVLMVDSGILDVNKEKAYNGILEQLQQLKNGDFDDDSLTASKMAVIDSAKTICDSPADIDAWHSTRAFDDNAEDMDNFVDYINNVTRQDIINVAKTTQLDTVYFLGSNGDNTVEEDQ